MNSKNMGHPTRCFAIVAVCVTVCMALIAVPLSKPPSTLPAVGTAYAANTTNTITLTTQPAAKIPNDSVTVVGDSVVLGAKMFASMASRIAKAKGVSWAKVDAKGSRQLAAGVALIKQLKTKAKLGKIVVIGLTTNGAFSLEQAKAARKACGADRYVVFINGYNKGYSYWKKSNASIKKLAASDPKVFVADWYSTIKSHGFSGLSDGHCHLNKTSGSWYVSTVIKAVKAAHAAKQAAYTKTLAKDASAVKASAATITKTQGASALKLSTAKIAAWAWQINLQVPAADPTLADAAVIPQYVSSKTSVATVSEKGVIVGKKAGSATITVTYGTLPTQKISVKVK